VEFPAAGSSAALTVSGGRARYGSVDRRRHGLPGDGDVQKLCQREAAPEPTGPLLQAADLGRGVIGWPDRSGSTAARLSRAQAAAPPPPFVTTRGGRVTALKQRGRRAA